MSRSGRCRRQGRSRAPRSGAGFQWQRRADASPPAPRSVQAPPAFVGQLTHDRLEDVGRCHDPFDRPELVSDNRHLHGPVPDLLHHAKHARSTGHNERVLLKGGEGNVTSFQQLADEIAREGDTDEVVEAAAANRIGDVPARQDLAAEFLLVFPSRARKPPWTAS